jgi:hypothetical protein
MPFKPMKRREFERWIREYGWSLVKAGMDWKLVDEDGHVIKPFIKITHPGGEVVASHVNEVSKLLTQRRVHP